MKIALLKGKGLRQAEADVDQLEEAVKLVGEAKRQHGPTKPANARGARSPGRELRSGPCVHARAALIFALVRATV